MRIKLFHIYLLIIILVSFSFISVSIIAQVETDLPIKYLLKGKNFNGEKVSCPFYGETSKLSIKDDCTGLVWARHELPTYGSKPDEEIRPGYSWDEAKTICESLEYGDYRLPTVEELLSLIEFDCDENGCISEMKWFPEDEIPTFAAGIYWTINDYNEISSWSEDNPGRDYKRTVNLLNGEVDTPVFGKNFRLNALCIMDRDPYILERSYIVATEDVVNNANVITQFKVKTIYNRQCTENSECLDNDVGTYCWGSSYCAGESELTDLVTPAIIGCVPSDNHIEGDACVANHPSGVDEFWTSAAGNVFNGLIDSCANDNYHRENNLCILNIRNCLYNGTCAGGDNDGNGCDVDAECPNEGVCEPGFAPVTKADQEWNVNTSDWFSCEATECIASAHIAYCNGGIDDSPCLDLIDSTDCTDGTCSLVGGCECPSGTFYDGEICNSDTNPTCSPILDNKDDLYIDNPQYTLIGKKTWVDAENSWSSCYADTCIVTPRCDGGDDNGKPCTDPGTSDDCAGDNICVDSGSMIKINKDNNPLKAYCQCPLDTHYDGIKCVSDTEACDTLSYCQGGTTSGVVCVTADTCVDSDSCISPMQFEDWVLINKEMAAEGQKEWDGSAWSSCYTTSCKDSDNGVIINPGTTNAYCACPTDTHFDGDASCVSDIDTIGCALNIENMQRCMGGGNDGTSCLNDMSCTDGGVCTLLLPHYDWTSTAQREWTTYKAFYCIGGSDDGEECKSHGDCDEGGTCGFDDTVCSSGSVVGNSCSSSSDCLGGDCGNVCVGGDNPFDSCSDDDDCLCEDEELCEDDGYCDTSQTICATGSAVGDVCSDTPDGNCYGGVCGSSEIKTGWSPCYATSCNDTLYEVYDSGTEDDQTDDFCDFVRVDMSGHVMTADMAYMAINPGINVAIVNAEVGFYPAGICENSTNNGDLCYLDIDCDGDVAYCYIDGYCEQGVNEGTMCTLDSECTGSLCSYNYDPYDLDDHVRDIRSDLTVETDSSGNYSIGITEGTYDIIVTHPDYLTESLNNQTVTGASTFDFTMMSAKFSINITDTGALDDYFKVWLDDDGDDEPAGTTGPNEGEGALDISVNDIGIHELKILYTDTDRDDFLAGFDVDITGPAEFLSTTPVGFNLRNCDGGADNLYSCLIDDDCTDPGVCNIGYPYLYHSLEGHNACWNEWKDVFVCEGGTKDGYGCNEGVNLGCGGGSCVRAYDCRPAITVTPKKIIGVLPGDEVGLNNIDQAGYIIIYINFPVTD